MEKQTIWGSFYRLPKRNRLIGLASILVILAILLAPPVTIYDKTHAVGYAICHQLSGRTFHLDGLALPLCARCTGSYLGFTMGLLALVILSRSAAVNLPRAPYLVLLVSFIALLGIDGLNSYLTFFPALPHLYPPQNWLRLSTGALYGIAMSTIVLPIFNYSLWRETDNRHIIDQPAQLIVLLISAAITIAAVLLAPPFFFYPLAILSTGGVMLMLTAVNLMIAVTMTHQEGKAENWAQAAPLLLLSVAMALVEIASMDIFRGGLTRWLNLPF
jgi:uncharacterized membrane protein